MSGPAAVLPDGQGDGRDRVEVPGAARRLARAASSSVATAWATVARAGGRRGDALTGLLTAEMFGQEVTAALDRSRQTGEPLAVLIVEVDRGSTLDARHGFGAADQVLVAVAGRLRLVARAEDALGRIGGDELAVLAEGLPVAEAGVSLARRLVDAASVPVHLGDREVQVSASVGAVVQRGGRRDGADDVLRDARLACHLARRRPAPRWEVFDRAWPAGDAAAGED